MAKKEMTRDVLLDNGAVVTKGGRILPASWERPSDRKGYKKYKTEAGGRTGSGFYYVKEPEKKSSESDTKRTGSSRRKPPKKPSKKMPEPPTPVDDPITDDEINDITPEPDGLEGTIKNPDLTPPDDFLDEDIDRPGLIPYALGEKKKRKGLVAL